VTTATHRNQQVIFPGKVHSSHYVGYTRASRNDAGVLINALVLWFI